MQVSAPVCIVGAGIAGLITATRLARNKARRVVVLESGLAAFDPEIDALNGIDNPGANYPALVNRMRGLGGTSLLWAGKLLPLSPGDTAPRPYLDLGGWPFDVAELDGYRDEIETLMGVDGQSYEEDVSGRVDRGSYLPRGDADFMLRWPKRPTAANHNLAHVLREQIATLENVEIWLGATVAEFQGDPDSGRITSLRAVNHAGNSLRVAASHFLIAAGALESTRLLLIADRQLNAPISGRSDVLGRYFNDHLGLNVATLRPLDWQAANAAFSDRSPFTTRRHLHFELRPELQHAHGVGSAYFDIAAYFPKASALPRLKAVLGSLRRNPAALRARDLRAGALELPLLLSYARWRFLGKQDYWPPIYTTLQVKVWVEQLPRWQNQIGLSEQLDGLGLPKLKLAWTSSDAEERTFRVMVDRIARYWGRHLARFGELQWAPLVAQQGSRLVDAATDLAHPAGSTRMGTSAADSVVDTAMIVHRIPNLSLASSSVFPTSGSANPTLTIMQLAMRAADAVDRRLAN
jgi:choline dehydrogenase-like flavoprotein